tara:strand:- start:191 stop:592 length:402 start_codon:yes stop_codon:yes gene_type:complete
MAKQVPMGVKVISILYYIGTAFLLVFGLLAIFGAGFITSLLPTMVDFTIGPGLFVFVGLVLVAFAVLSYFIARGLWHGKNWARIIVIVFAAFGLLNAFTTLSQGLAGGISSIVINLLIGGYLAFDKNVRKAFR